MPSPFCAATRIPSELGGGLARFSRNIGELTVNIQGCAPAYPSRIAVRRERTMSEAKHQHKKPSSLGNLVVGISCLDVVRALVERDGADTVAKALVAVIAEKRNRQPE
jgi:hypothetical protein